MALISVLSGALVALTLASSTMGAAAAPAGGGFKATVVSIGDGGTLRVSPVAGGSGRPVLIRLACTDVPETPQSPWGQPSCAYLQQRLASGRQVSLLPHATDPDGRIVAEVISDLNINLVMVEDGQACADRPWLGGCNAREYRDAESRASRHHDGVWQVEGGITRPWDFPRGCAAVVIPDGTTAAARRWRCREIGSHARAQQLLRQGHPYP